MVALEAQNLTHLVDKSHHIADPDLDEAQLKHLHKVMKDSFIHHQAKFIVKMHAKTKNARTVWEHVCKTHDESISTSMNGDATLGWPAGVKLDACNWNKPQGKFVTFCGTQGNKFNEMCPDSFVKDEQAVRMLLNGIASGTPNLVNVLNLHGRAEKAAGQCIKIFSMSTLPSLSNKPKFVTTQRCVQVAIVTKAPLLIILPQKDKNMRKTFMTLMKKETLKPTLMTFGRQTQ